MKKFLLMAALVAAAAYLVHHRLLPLWGKDKPTNVAKTDKPAPPPAEVTKDPPPSLPLTDGLALAAEGKFAEAVPVLKREIDELEAKSSPDAARHVAALARCYDAVESAEKAAEAWRRLVRQYPTAPEKSEALYWLAKHAVSEEEAKQYLEDAANTAGDSEGKRLAEADKLIDLSKQEGKEYDARAGLSKVLRAGLPDAKAREVKEIIARLNKRLIWSMIKTHDSEEYKVESGNTLLGIAQRHKTTVGLIQKINKLQDTRIKQGQILKVLPCEECELIVSKSKLTLQLWLRGNFIKEYPVCIGDPENSPTPEGVFTIGAETRMENPVWKDKAFGDPENILGTRWMGFREMKSYGVHGTTQPATVPGRKSAGCVRMFNADVEEVFDFAIGGTKVTILP